MLSKELQKVSEVVAKMDCGDSSCLFAVKKGGMPRWIAIHVVQTQADGRPVTIQTEGRDAPQAAADALTAKLKQLRAALADVLGDETLDA